MKKAIAFVLIAAMAVSLLASCEKPQTTATATAVPTTENTETSSPTDTIEANTVIFVSENGDDTNDGTKDAPLKSFGAAFAKASAASGDVDVIFDAGRYLIDSSVTINGDDFSGRQLNFIGTDGAVLTGATYFEASDFEPLSGSFAERFPEDARESIVMLDLTKYGFDAETMYNLPLPRKTVYQNGSLLTLARYPNLKDGERNTNYLKTQEGNFSEGDNENEWIIKLGKKDVARVASWAEPEEVTVYGRFRYLWREYYGKIKSFDESTRNMVMDVKLDYGIAERRPYCFFNAPEELDTAGEFYISKDGVLYIVKSDDFDSSSVSIPILGQTMFVMKNAKNVSFSDLVIECSSDHLFTGSVNGLTVSHCELRDTYRVADLTGTDIVITNCEIHESSGRMITLNGGDKLNLISSGNKLTYCDVHDWSVGPETYASAIEMQAVGTYVAHNYFHDSAWGCGGIGLLGIFEYNEIGNVLTFADDIGAIGCGGTTELGGIIRYNYIHDVGKKSLIDTGCAGIYCDNCANGGTAYGNIVSDVAGRGFLIGGGRAFNVYGNIVFGTSNVGFNYDERGRSWEDRNIRHAWSRAMEFAETPYLTAPAWTEAFPWIKAINYDPDQTDKDAFGYPGNPGNSVFKDNIYIMSKAESNSYNFITDEEKLAFEYDIEPLVYKYSDIEPLNYFPTDIIKLTLEDVIALDLPDFIDIPFDEIGLK